MRVALPLVVLDSTWEFHRDELLYFAMGDHLDFWHMQFPPLLPAVAALAKGVFGESVFAARVPAALAGGLLLTWMLLTVRAMGGRTFALILTAIASLAAPVFVRPSVLMQPVIFDQMWASLALLGVVLACVRRDARWWLVTGVALGLGTLTKFSAPLYGVIVGVVALIIPATRAQLRTRWPWIAVLIALIIAVPSVTGQYSNHWPFFAQLRVLRAGQLAHTSIAEYLTGQVLMLGAAIIPAMAGIRWSAAPSATGRSHEHGTTAATDTESARRFVLVFAALVVGWYLLMHGKEYYAAVAYPMLIASGAAAIESQLAERVPVRTSRIAAGTLLAGVSVGAVLLLPMGIPCFTPAAMVRYVTALGFGTRTNYGTTLDLPQDYADMLGWRAEVDLVVRAYMALSSAEQNRVTISAGNYGQVAALAFYGPSRGLPYPVSTRSDFWAWGPGPRDGDLTLIAVTADDRDGYRVIWRALDEVGAVRDRRRVDEERDVRVLLLRGIRVPLAELWRTRGPGWG